MKNELHFLIGLTALWIAGILAAPIFAGSFLSDLLYRLYSGVCHQFDSRSFHIHNEPLAVCIRCSGIYAGFLAMLIVVRISRRLRGSRPGTMKILLIAGTPMLMDGSLSLFGIVESTVVSRAVTGLLFGGGCALLLHEAIGETLHSLFTFTKKNYEPETR